MGAFSVDSLQGMLSQSAAAATDTKTTALKNKLNSVTSDTEDEKLKAACKEFEAYFIEQCYKEMMNTIPKSETTDSSLSMLTDFYKDNFVQTVAGQTADQEGLGLAQQLYEQMKRMQGVSPVKVEESK